MVGAGLEKEAEPRLPVNAINAARTELELIAKAEADRVASLERHGQSMDNLRAELDQMKKECSKRLRT